MTERDEIAAYYSGMAEGIERFAHWRDGVQYVGTAGKTLKRALEELREERKRQLAGAVD